MLTSSPPNLPIWKNHLYAVAVSPPVELPCSDSDHPLEVPAHCFLYFLQARPVFFVAKSAKEGIAAVMLAASANPDIFSLEVWEFDVEWRLLFDWDKPEFPNVSPALNHAQEPAAIAA